MAQITTPPTIRSAPIVVSVEEINPGMVLAEEVYDQRGRLLSRQGATLTRRLQRQMRLWGVEIVTIESPHVIPPLPVNVEQSAPVSSFDADERDPFMRALAETTERRTTRQDDAAKGDEP